MYGLPQELSLQQFSAADFCLKISSRLLCLSNYTSRRVEICGTLSLNVHVAK